MNKCKIIALFVIVVTILSGCGKTGVKRHLEKIAEDKGNAETVVKGDDSSNAILRVDGTGEYEGVIEYTILNAQKDTNIYRLGVQREFLSEISDVFNPETGNLDEGYTFVLVSLHVDNINAAPPEDLFPSGIALPETSFRADMLYLADLSNPNEPPDYWESVVYFDAPVNYDIHPMAFVLPEGESIDYKIGFLTSAAEFQNLYLCTCSGGDAGVFAPLEVN